ncbi:MAG TPA: phosphoribosylglycinamide formyltransferase [Salinimicrobium sp.]|nr:phosphoribosylglycinamide formyltransferase [Salinimicrobium sp.]
MPNPKNPLQKNLVIFASGSGTNAENIIKYFQDIQKVEISGIFSNNPSAGVLERAKKFQVKTYIFGREEFYNSEEILNNLVEIDPDLIVLAGFLWIFPQNILHRFPNKVINLHPALLPKFGGKGMYGMKVHQAVLDKKEAETGISIHFVNEKYDDGEIIFQKRIQVGENDTAEDIAGKIHQLEYRYFPKVIEKLLFPEDV